MKTGLQILLGSVILIALTSCASKDYIDADKLVEGQQIDRFTIEKIERHSNAISLYLSDETTASGQLFHNAPSGQSGVYTRLLLDQIKVGETIVNLAEQGQIVRLRDNSELLKYLSEEQLVEKPLVSLKINNIKLDIDVHKHVTYMADLVEVLQVANMDPVLQEAEAEAAATKLTPEDVKKGDQLAGLTVTRVVNNKSSYTLEFSGQIELDGAIFENPMEYTKEFQTNESPVKMDFYGDERPIFSVFTIKNFDELEKELTDDQKQEMQSGQSVAMKLKLQDPKVSIYFGEKGRLAEGEATFYTVR